MEKEDPNGVEEERVSFIISLNAVPLREAPAVGRRSILH
jgi:hypothetical protein